MFVDARCNRCRRKWRKCCIRYCEHILCFRWSNWGLQWVIIVLISRYWVSSFLGIGLVKPLMQGWRNGHLCSICIEYQTQIQHINHSLCPRTSNGW